MALAGAAGLRAAGEDPIDAGEYVFTLMLSAIWVWPLYMAALYALGAAVASGSGRWRSARSSWPA